MKLIDVHSHINLLEETKLSKVVKDAKTSGVLKIIDSGETLEENAKALANSKFYPVVFASFGFDPSNLNKREAKMIGDYIRERQNEIVAIGEVGLDFWKVKENKEREVQKEIFRRFIGLAIELGLPLVVHSRSAGKYAIEILKEKGAKRVCMHAFDGSAANAQKGVELGYFFSIPPSVARSQQKQKLVERIPLDNLLLESDAPMLGPEKGVENTPSNISVAAGEIAEIKGISVEEVAEKTTKNAMGLFNLSKSVPHQSQGLQSGTKL